jgi:predicted hydrocarbon binding protein
MMFDIRKIQEQVIFSAIKAASNDETATKIVYGERELSSSEDNATWVKSTMNRLENHFDKCTVKQIRMNCQCGYAMDEKLELVKELIESSSNLEEFANQSKAKAAGLSYTDGELYLQFPFCPCPMLADVDKLDTDTWCQCTTGYSKVLFEKAFGCEVDVELLKSIKMGDNICLMKIIPLNSIWK